MDLRSRATRRRRPSTGGRFLRRKSRKTVSGVKGSCRHATRAAPVDSLLSLVDPVCFCLHTILDTDKGDEGGFQGDWFRALEHQVQTSDPCPCRARAVLRCDRITKQSGRGFCWRTRCRDQSASLTSPGSQIRGRGTRRSKMWRSPASRLGMLMAGGRGSVWN